MTELTDYQRMVEEPRVRAFEATVANLRAQASSDKAEIARLVEENARLQDGLRNIVAAEGKARGMTAGQWKIVADQETTRATRAEALAARYRADVEKLREALGRALPMAKGYAHEHPVGANQEKCNDAAHVLAEAAPAETDGREG